MVATAWKRSMGPCTGWTVVVARNPRQPSWSNLFSESMGNWWHFCPRPLVAPTPGNQERSYGWPAQMQLKRSPFWFNGRCQAGTGSCNGGVSGRPVGEVPTETPEPPPRQEGWRKQWINTIPFGSGLSSLVGWMHGGPPGFHSLPWPILPVQEPRGEAELDLRMPVKV